MRASIPNPKRLLPWAAIIGVGLLVRAALIGRLGTLWFDEAFSWRFARMPFFEMLELLRADVHPPLHAVLLHYWMKLLGDGVTAFRLMSWSAAAAGLIALALLGRRLIGKKPTFLAVTLASLSPLMAYYGADGRMYALVFLLSSLSALWFWSAVQGDETKRRPWFYASLALVLTHVTGILPAAAQALFLLRHPERRASLKKLLPGFAVLAGVFLAWLIPTAAARLSYASGEWQFAAADNSVNAAAALTYWVWLGSGKMKIAAAFAFIILALLAGTLRHSEHRPRFKLSEEGEFLAIWFALAFVPFLFLDAVPPRYLIAAIPPFFLLLAHGFMNAGRHKRLTLALGVFSAVLISYHGLVVQLSSRPYEWDKARDWIAERKRTEDRVVLGWFADKMAFDALAAAPFNRDPAALGEISGLYPFDDELDEDARYVAHAGTLSISSSDFERLGPLFEGADRVFFIPNYDWTLADGGSASDALNDWLRENGWFLADRLEPSGRTQAVWLLARK